MTEHTHYFWPVHYVVDRDGFTTQVMGKAHSDDGPTFWECDCGEQGYPL